MYSVRVSFELLLASLLLISPSTCRKVRRTLPDSPEGYTPSHVQCPSSRPVIRSAGDLSNIETEWLQKRRSKSVQPMKDFLGRLGIDGFDTDAYIDQGASDFSRLPNVGIAFSGGGYRAMTNGAGAYAAFDSRTPGSNETGHLGGLLQLATYVSGLSGGGWLVGSLYAQNFSSVTDILEQNRNGSNLWALDRNIIEGPDTGSFGILSTASYLDDLYDDVQGKRDAHFDSSITDYWGRGLSYQWFTDPDGGAAHTFSSMSETPGLSDGDIPMPILVADGRAPGEKLISSNTTIYEFTPWELGSFDPTLYAFAPLKYVGSNFEAGAIPSGEQCVVGFDNAGFVMGTSSSLFNIALDMFVSTPEGSGLLGTVKGWVQDLASAFGDDENDIASWSPNPFYRWNGTPAASDKNLTLVDGGEDGQNIPLYPHIQTQRNVDVVFAIDSSADTENGTGWPNGTSLIASYERSKNATVMNGTAFPAIPDINTFINLGLNARPTFFGCDPNNQSAPTPIVVYIPNHPYSYWSNISTYTIEMDDEERDGIIRNGYEAATMGNGTAEQEWPVCVGCAILSRSFARTGTAVPQQCSDCFAKHCWNGARNSSEAYFYPPMGGAAAQNPGTVGVSATKSSAAINGVSKLPLMAISLLVILIQSI